MKRAFKWLGLGVLGLVVAGGLLAAHTWYAKPLRIGWFYDRVFLKFLLEDPELLTRLRVLEGVGLRSHNARLTDASPAHTDRVYARVRDDLATLRSYDSSGFTGQDRLSYDILEHFLRTMADGERWRYHDYPVNSTFGVQSELPTLMAQSQQVNDATDAQHYVTRLEAFPAKFAQLVASLEARERRGVVPPHFAIVKTLEQMRGFIGTDPRDNVLYTSLRERLDGIPAERMTQTERTEWLAKAERNITDSVYPAYRTLIAQLEALEPRAQRDAGVWSLPDGAAYYQYLIELHTTTRYDAAELHRRGVAEVERIGAQMDRILREAGYTEGTLGERIQALSRSPAQLYPDTDAGRAQILADYQRMIDEINAGLDPLFGTQPRSGVEVRRMQAFAEKTAPGAYYQPAPLDGSQPGVFYANLYDVTETPKFGMRTLAYHEAVPGHHLQTAIAQELEGLPTFRRVVPYTAFSEGWALYAERLAAEAGYLDDPLDDLGRLQAEMFRAVRLVVDTGIHAQRWTLEQAVDYMMEHTGMPPGEVHTEVERYFVMPGQALAYKVGMMKILELRERAQTALGPEFDLRAFHDAVLTNGEMPLELLERVVDGYIARVKGGGAS